MSIFLDLVEAFGKRDTLVLEGLFLIIIFALNLFAEFTLNETSSIFLAH